jgi:hypothetical protein
VVLNSHFLIGKCTSRNVEASYNIGSTTTKQNSAGGAHSSVGIETVRLKNQMASLDAPTIVALVGNSPVPSIENGTILENPRKLSKGDGFAKFSMLPTKAI